MVTEALCKCGRSILDGVFCSECGFEVPACKCASIDNVVDITKAATRKKKPPPTPFIGDDRPEIDAGIGDLAEASSQAQDALEEANEPARYFSHGGELVRIEHDDDGRPFTRPLGVNHLRHHLARAAHYFKRTLEGKVDARPPQDVVQDLLASLSECGRRFGGSSAFRCSRLTARFARRLGTTRRPVLGMTPTA